MDNIALGRPRGKVTALQAQLVEQVQKLGSISVFLRGYYVRVEDLQCQLEDKEKTVGKLAARIANMEYQLVQLAWENEELSTAYRIMSEQSASSEEGGTEHR